MIVLREVKNVKYGTFMQPGRRMDVAVELMKRDGDTGDVQGQGRRTTPGSRRCRAQFTLHGYNLRGPRPGRGRGRRAAGRALEGPLGAADRANCGSAEPGSDVGKDEPIDDC